MIEIDAKDKRCPMPIVLLAKEMRKLAPGTVVRISANDPVFEPDVTAWAEKTGNRIESLTCESGVFIATIKKT